MGRRGWGKTAAFLALFFGVSMLGGCKRNIQEVLEEPVTFYLSPEGKEDGKGVKENPFGSFERAFEVLKPGDELVLMGGVYPLTDSVTIPESMGDCGKKPVTIRGEDGKKAVLDGSGLPAGEDGTSLLPMMDIRGKNIVISHLSFQNQKGPDACGILIRSGAKKISVEHSEFSGISTGSNWEKEEKSANALLVFGDGKDEIREIRFHDNRIFDCLTGWGEAVSVTGNCRDIQVCKNEITNTGNIGIDFSGNYGYCGIKELDHPRDCLAEGNIVRDCVSEMATSYGIYADGAQDVRIIGNQVSGCGGGVEVGAEQPDQGYPTKNILVSDNELIDNRSCSLAIGGYDGKGDVTEVTVEENRCIQHGAEDAVVSLSRCHKVSFQKNVWMDLKGGGEGVLFDCPFDRSQTYDITFSENQFYGGEDPVLLWQGKEYDSFAAWAAATGTDPGEYRK